MFVRRFTKLQLSRMQGRLPDKYIRNRSRQFVECLASKFREASVNSNVRVLSKGCFDHQAEFGLNELLFDILVCEVGLTKSPRQGKDLTYISRALWQIESEFSTDARQALFDFNKLVLGSAPNKLFIGSQTEDDKRFLGTLLPAARACSGEIHVALLPHPSRWRHTTEVRCWRIFEEAWEPIEA